jgi:CDP-paratose 2-epimerase
VAHFIISALLDTPLCLYGDGKQIRDVLFVLDLARAFELALQRIDRVAGECFNIGGGAANTLSLLELIGLIEQRLQHKLPRSFGKWRPGDQRVYVSDIGKARRLLGWQPQITAPGGVAMLLDWVQANKELFYEPRQHKLVVSQYRHSRQGRGRQHPLGLVRPERGHPAPQRVHS